MPQDFDEVIAAMAGGVHDAAGWVKDPAHDLVVEAIESLQTGTAIKVLVSAT